MFWFKKETPEEKLKRKYLENVEHKKILMEIRLEKNLEYAIKNCDKSFEFETNFEDRLERICMELGIKCKCIGEKKFVFYSTKYFKIYGWAEIDEKELEPQKSPKTAKEIHEWRMQQQMENIRDE